VGCKMTETSRLSTTFLITRSARLRGSCRPFGSAHRQDRLRHPLRSSLPRSPDPSYADSFTPKRSRPTNRSGQLSVGDQLLRGRP
jgi:hypothetical protein